MLLKARGVTALNCTNDVMNKTFKNCVQNVYSSMSMQVRKVVMQQTIISHDKMMSLMSLHAQQETNCWWNTSTKATCSLKLLNEYIIQCGYYPSKGMWVRSNTHNPHFEPGICLLSKAGKFNMNIIQYICYTNTMVSLLGKVGYICQM